jgi:hypothetical protein
MSEKHQIDKYLLSTCLFVIDDLCEEYSGISAQSPELEEIAENYSEADLVFRIGYPFGHRARFSMQTAKGKKNDSNDIEVKSKNFKIEVKFLKRYKSNKGNTSSNKIVWKQIQGDFNWLRQKIENGYKGECAFIIGWFNSTDRFSQQIQLGTKSGNSYQVISHEKECYFPFLGYDEQTRSTKSVFYEYKKALEPIELPISLATTEKMCCIFLGQPEDKFHMAIYY